MVDIISKIMPIILLILLGRFFYYKKIIQQNTINEMKKFVIDITLSAVLFITFINMEFRKEYFLISLIVFIMLIALYLIGMAINRLTRLNHALLPFTISGCALGLFGIPLFSTVFGIENLGKLSIIAIGHEFFIWCVFYAHFLIKFEDKGSLKNTVRQVIKSPTIISMLLGIVLNLTGLNMIILNNPVGKGFFNSIEYLAALSTPLILIIIGYGLKFNKKYMHESIKFLVIRMSTIFLIGYTFKKFIIDRIMMTDVIFDYAYFTFLITPLPFSLALFVGSYSTKENEELINNTIVLNTVVSIIIFIAFLFIKI